MTAPTTHRPHQQRQFRAMGTQIHMVITGPLAESLVDRGVAMISELEAKWSRFLPTSETSHLNSAAGRPRTVSAETFGLVERAVAGWVLTDGRFDPTMLRNIEGLGYDRTFEQVSQASGKVRGPEPGHHCASIELDADNSTVRFPVGVSFDPGGIGKGLAADLVCCHLMDLGAHGAMVNVGGDLRVQGESPSGECWAVEVREPALHDEAITTAYLADGALATSTTLKRVWQGPEGPRHHLLDPSTGLSHSGGPVLASVVAGEAWWAEVVATSLVVTPAGGVPTLPAGSSALVVTNDHLVHRIGQFERFEKIEELPTESQP